MCQRLKYEQAAYQKGKKYIVGLDEAGRGPMAGPLVVGAVIFEKGYYNDDINDFFKEFGIDNMEGDYNEETV